MLVNNQTPTLLIVEDEAIVAMDMREQLIELGYLVCGIANNADKAIALARLHRPDLVLMDIVIKGNRDGVHAAEVIGRSLHIPVVFLTAYSDASTVERAAKTAPYGYLTKPFQTKELRAAIEVALYKSAIERRLRDSERWFSATLHCVVDAVIATDPDETVRFMNPAAEHLTGWKAEEALGRPIADIFVLHSTGLAVREESVVHRVLRENVVAGIDYGAVVQARDGTCVPVDHSAAPIRDSDDQVMGAVIVFRDVSVRLQVEESLRNSEERFRNAFDFAPVGMALVALDGKFLQVNEALCKLLGIDEPALMMMTQPELTHPADATIEKEHLTMLLTGVMPATQFEKRYLLRDHTALWALVSISLLRDKDEPRCYLYQVHDLTQRKETEFQLARLAHFDPLTGLSNRLRLRDESERMLNNARRRQEAMAVIFLDLDYFKFINDSLGHDAGDQLLIAVANRLKAGVRDTDLVARLGGDEFVILVGEITQAGDISAITQKILATLSAPWQFNEQTFSISTSIGISMYPEDGTDMRTLFSHADSALYDAKAEGRNRAHFYRAELGTRIDARLKLEAALRQAIAERAFTLFFQPIIDVNDGRAVGAEALVRWPQADGSMIAPDNFIPLSEETGLIVDLGEWIMHAACAEAVKWREAGVEVPVSVNVSPRQFKAGNLTQVIQHALAATGLPPHLLCIEITEQMALTHTQEHLAVLDDIKALGATIALDDFGVGYSSLSYIKRFGPRSLKIDRSFITDVTTDADDAAIVKAVLAMSKQLRIRVVAEGVETETVHQFLQQVGCEEAQGYYFARPCDGSQFLSWLIANHAASRA